MNCPLVMDGLVTIADLNVLPHGSYDVLIGMDWLEAHRVNIDCYNKTFECLDEEGNLRVVKGIPKVISGRKNLAIQLKKFYGKSCRVYTSHVLEAAEYDTPRLEGFHMLQEFGNVIPGELPRIPPKSDINLTFELVPGTARVSQTPCRMSIPEILELKMKLQELWEKKHIRATVSPWGVPIWFDKEKYGTLWFCIDYR